MPASVQGKMNDYLSVAFNSDQFCDLVTCILLQTDTVENTAGRKEIPVPAGTAVLLRESGIKALFVSIPQHPLQHSCFPDIAREGHCLP